MNRAILVALGTGTIITSAAAIGIGASVQPKSSTMSRSEYQVALAQVREREPRLLAGCEAVEAAQRELCRARIGGELMVQVADLEQGFRRTPEAARDAQRARIDAQYQVERARCATLKGYARDKCLIRAHATRGRALLQSQAPYANHGS